MPQDPDKADPTNQGGRPLMVTPLPDPFAREVVVVPARGVERWLTQRLSHRLGVGARAGDGVCAGVDFVTPHSLVSMLLDRDAEDPWSPDRLAWPLLEVVDEAMGAPGFEDLTTHLGGGDPADERSARRYAVARRPVLVLRRPAPAARPRLAGGRRHRRCRRPARSRPAVAGRAVAPARRPRRGARTRPAPRHDARAAARRWRRPRPSGPALALRAHPPARDRGRAAACPR